ncbi:MAG: hypothetical protein IPM26_11400 [Saprospiraceae bacterium]|nr:hypothetical protein [Saprospiraceae bacterium]
MRCFLWVIIWFWGFAGNAQEIMTDNALQEGIVTCGYISNGAYLNFTGPNIHVVFRYSKIMFGMLPSLRFRNDREIPGHSFITPGLGFGISYCYKKLVIQLPFYYHPKPIQKTEDGVRVLD